jgi:hypothetical protein
MLNEFRRVLTEEVWPNVTEVPFSNSPAASEIDPKAKSPALDRLRALTQPVGKGNGAPAQDYNSNRERELMN